MDIASIITSSTINQTKMASVNNTHFNPPCTYPVNNGAASPNGTHLNGHTDNITSPSACRSPTGVYLPPSPTYFNCVMPSNGIGGGNVDYFQPANANVRMRMLPYLAQPYEMMPFFQGYQVRADLWSASSQGLFTQYQYGFHSGICWRLYSTFTETILMAVWLKISNELAKTKTDMNGK